jgi:hypothetical protein
MTVEVELLNSRRLLDVGWGLYFDPTVGIKLVPTGDLMAEGGQVIRCSSRTDQESGRSPC